ncbi:MAG: transporter substrate-binding domain-containing protein [Prevotella sp.]|nr:transporter substrate-binding domain-containing protein [Prevotella sp.]
MMLLLSVYLSLVVAFAQSDTTRVFSVNSPLIYEDVWDLWPYSFLNDNGDPDGFNVDLIRLIMKELDIPYEIRLKPSSEAFCDLKEGKSDLMLGLAVGFHDEFGKYSKNAVTLFTQSVVTPKNKQVVIKRFRDLSNHQVIVCDSSLVYHLMLEYGWGENATPVGDMSEAIQEVSAKGEGQIVWNTLSLKWLMNRYHIDNLELTPVNMPHGEYKFMSNNQQLLDKLDEAYTRLYTNDKIQPLQDKWFYPERQNMEEPKGLWYLLGGGLLLLVFMAVYGISYRIQNRKIRLENVKRNNRLALILQTSQVHIWTYDIKTNQFSWHNDNGQVAYTYTMEEFSQRYSREDFVSLKSALDKLAETRKTDEEEKEIELNLRAKDMEDGDTNERDYHIVLSVLSRDKKGNPAVIIGTKKDVTEEQQQKRLDEERTLRYWSIFYTPILGIILFNKDGRLVNINPKACDIFGCNADEIIEKGVDIHSMFNIDMQDLEDVNGYQGTQTVGHDMITEFRLMTIHDDAGEMLGVFAFCRDITMSVSSKDLEQEGQKKIDALRDEQRQYTEMLNAAISDTDIRQVTYSPGSHTLTIYRGTGIIQHALTQTRCMTLVDEQSQRQVLRLLTDMDDYEDKVIEYNIRTTLRSTGGRPLILYFRLEPSHDNDGKVKEYHGMLRDMSEMDWIERQMDLQTAKVQEVEKTKNSFVKNMVQEIRNPMNAVVKHVAQISDDSPSANEPELSKVIQQNSDYLLHIIDTILFLSRLEAKMVEINRQPQNFAELFESQCATGWRKFMNADTHYIVENPYEQLTVDIDAENLGHVIEQVTRNAAQHTKRGTVRARYDYIGRRLIISVDDTGEGIPEAELTRIQEEELGGAHNTKGLGLAITKELVRQMGGTFEISSEEGSGTTIYIMIPCHASVIKRKKTA